jgi:FrmR/RcnR family transcriptional regulator, repressor of frmRAB operon
MSHTTQSKGKLLARVHRIQGQVQAIEKALRLDQDCTEVLQLLASTRGAMNGLMNGSRKDIFATTSSPPNPHPLSARARRNSLRSSARTSNEVIGKLKTKCPDGDYAGAKGAD